ncbi:MAG TPA: glycosyltransferase family 2 protein [Anaerolineaceae bacterium]|jgi:succinoglycan biosynthesis protein ExoA
MNPPLVSIIVPCYNEETTIRLLLEAIFQQTYPRTAMEVLIADGLSTDQTRSKVTAFQINHAQPPITIIDNPKRIIPSALNVALEASHGEIIVRLDAHSMPDETYISRCVEALEQHKGDNIGGVWEIRPGGTGWQASAIAAAAAHPLGVGDALYRYTHTAGSVDTVPFGAFRKDLIHAIGPFDETLLTNEDYEFNVRVRQHGGRVWLDPAIRSVYFARSTLAALAQQYWRYGYWKSRMLRRYPKTLRWRQALPPVFVLSLLVLALLAPWSGLARWLLLAEGSLYLLILLAAATQIVYRHKDVTNLIGAPLAMATMHLAWGSGFLWSLLK